MLFDELAFPPHEGLPWRPNPPTPDGYVEPEPNIVTSEIEAGYTNGGRFDFGGDTNVPISVIQCVRHATQDLIYLGLVARFDKSFDDNDFVMIVLRPDAGAAPSDQDRQVIVKPVSSTAGAVGGAFPVTPEINPGHIRTDRDPFVHPVIVRMRDTSPAMPHPVWKDVGTIANLSIKVRSASSGTGNFWSVEAQIPTKKTTGSNPGGIDWIDLKSPFGLYLNIGKVSYVGSVPHVDQSTWPFDPAMPLKNIIADPLDNYEEDWDPPILGRGLMVTSQAANTAKGVKFQAGASSIGVLNGSAIGTTLDMAVNAQNTLVARLVNTANPDPAGATDADVEATFRLAEFGIPGPGYSNGNANAAWQVISDTPGLDNVGPNPTNAVHLPATGTTPAPTDATLAWKISQEDHNTYQALWDDQCLWVELSSASGANIVQSSVRQNLSLINQMSRVNKKATIDGRGFGHSAAADGKHHIVLHVATMPIPERKVDVGIEEIDHWLEMYEQTYGDHMAEAMSGPRRHNALRWVSIVNAYRVTGKRLTIGGKEHRIMVHGGSYGFIAQHVLEAGETPDGLEFHHVLTGDGVRDHGDGTYEVSVPVNGKVTVTNTLEPRRVRVGDHRIPWWLRLWRWLVRLWHKLFG
jgi:hypothetical protein